LLETRADLFVADLIDLEAGCWREDLVRQIFFPLDAEVILNIPLCTTWPDDNLIWHYSADGEYSVRSAYHLLRDKMRLGTPSSSGGLGKDLWRKIWKLNVPPRVKVFGWRLGIGAIPTKGNIARRIPGYDMRCGVCGHVEDHEVHALFECQLAGDIWRESSFDSSLWDIGLRSAMDVLVHASDKLDTERFGEFVAVMWAIWSERHRLIFGQQASWDTRFSASRAIQLVRLFREFQEKDSPSSSPSNEYWKPPQSGCFKLNFDAGRTNEDWHGWGFLVRNHEGEVVLAGVQQNKGFVSPEEEEARACLYALRTAIAHGYRRLMIEGDCQSLLRKLQLRLVPNNFLGFILSDILSLSEQLDFCVWKFVKRGCNEVAHAIAHLLPITSGERLWVTEGPDVVYDLAAKDMCNYVDYALI